MPGHCSAFKSSPHILKVLPNRLRGLWIKGKALSMFRPWSLYLQLKKKKKMLTLQPPSLRHFCPLQSVFLLLEVNDTQSVEGSQHFMFNAFLQQSCLPQGLFTTLSRFPTGTPRAAASTAFLWARSPARLPYMVKSFSSLMRSMLCLSTVFSCSVSASS